MQAFGAECSNEVIDAGREAMRLAVLAPERSDSRTTAQEYLRLRGLSEEQISHVHSVYAKILSETFCQVNHADFPAQEIQVVNRDNGKQQIRRPLNVYCSRTDRVLLDRAFQLLSFTECYRKWIKV